MVWKLREWIFQWANHPAPDAEAKKPAPFLPNIDAFVSEAKRQFRRYWLKKDNALRQDWSEAECLWLSPPFSLYPQLVGKIFSQGARGIAIVPKWERQDCYWALGQAQWIGWTCCATYQFFRMIPERYIHKDSGAPAWCCSMHVLPLMMTHTTFSQRLTKL